MNFAASCSLHQHRRASFSVDNNVRRRYLQLSLKFHFIQWPGIYRPSLRMQCFLGPFMPTKRSSRRNNKFFPAFSACFSSFPRYFFAPLSPSLLTLQSPLSALPFPEKLHVISVRSPFPVISLWSPVPSHCCPLAIHFRDFVSGSFPLG